MSLITVIFAEWNVNKIYPFQLQMFPDAGEMTPCLGSASNAPGKKKESREEPG